MRREASRMAWVSARAREVWEPRIQRVSNAWFDVELASVKTGLRRAALVFTADRVRTSGLRHVEVAADRFAAGPGADALAAAFTAGDDERVGALLGYPACCRAFFARTWGAGSTDPTGAMGAADPGLLACNILGRRVGVRLVPHLPCSFGCAGTAALAMQLRPLWPPQELSRAEEMLGWPMRWSALRGVSITTWPILKVVAQADYAVETHTIAWRGLGTYPAEGARGLCHPFDAHPRDGADPRDNGFSSIEAMDQAHNMVLTALRASPPRGEVLDLGCGNGRLLVRVHEAFDVPVQGIERDPARARQHPDIVVGDLRRVGELMDARRDTILVSQRRFEEIPDLEAWARAHARQVLVYSYDAPMFARVA